MRVACVQFDIAWEDKPVNHRRIEKLLRDARPSLEAGTFVLLPELADTGFSMNLDHIADDATLPWACSLAKDLGVFVQCGFARRVASAKPPGRNCAAVISPDGRVLTEYQKVHPFSFGREAEHYSGGEHLCVAACGEAVVCPLICYDLRFPEMWRLAALGVPSAEVFTIGASWPSARQHHWRSLCIARAIENQAFVVAVNRCGSDPYLRYDGGSLIIAPTGEILAEANKDEMVLQATIDLTALRGWRKEFPALTDAHREFLGDVPRQVAAVVATHQR